MEKKTKYSIGDEVWFMADNHAVSGNVVGYNISFGEGEYYGEFMTGSPKSLITYYIKKTKIYEGILKIETEVFPTKEELLKSL